MQNNSQGRHDRFNAQAISADDTADVRGHSAEPNSDGEAAVIEKTATIISGVVTDCLRLNVRAEPNSDGEILTVIDALTEVTVDIDSSSEAFYKVCTAAGIEGFCMKKYIALRS